MPLIFRTQRSKKLLKISVVEILSDKHVVSLSDKHVVNSKSLQAALPTSINSLDNGQIVHISNVEGLRILVWNFDVFTRCSQASEDDFAFVDASDRYFKFQNSPCTSAHISLPYIMLKQGLDEAKLIFDESFIYPKVSKVLRVDVLCWSLEHYNYIVKTIIKSSKSTHHYCKFSGVEISTYMQQNPHL